MNKAVWTAAVLAGLAWPAGARPIVGGPAEPSRESFAVKARRELDELGRKIDALEASARREGRLVRARVEADVKILRADQRDAARELSKLEAAGAAARKDLAERAERALRKLREAYRKAVAKPAK